MYLFFQDKCRKLQFVYSISLFWTVTVTANKNMLHSVYISYTVVLGPTKQESSLLQLIGIFMLEGSRQLTPKWRGL